MAINGPTPQISTHEEHPPRADLREMMDKHPLPTLAPGLVEQSAMVGETATTYSRAVIYQLNKALATFNAEALQDCFYADQAYWRDQLALTWHLRTFMGPRTIAKSFLETAKMRDLTCEINIDGEAVFLPVTPVLQYIDCPITFRTRLPAGLCRGKMLLLPVMEVTANITWRIWIMSTRLESLDLQAEDKELLQAPARQLHDSKSFDTDVFIVGAGNAAISLSARLKALGVESVMADRNARPGDNWALRYDCMRFHIPAPFCDLPYMPYDKKLQSPHLLTRDDLAAQVHKYVELFKLNILQSAQIQWTKYDELTKRWTITFQTPAGQHNVTSKHLVLATGIGSQEPNRPHIADTHLYKGVSIHSVEYRNAQVLVEQGVKSVMVIGSANTAFDVLEDCHSAGLKATMVVRSPTYIVPLEYVCHKASLGAYETGVDEADKLFLSLPTVVDGQLGRGLFATFASESSEQKRYAALKEAGFPVLDSREPTCALAHNLLERAGGHYVDVGGTKLIEQKKVGIKAGVEPVGYTEIGLRFSDGSCLNADAIIWCTGFADSNVVTTAAEILGAKYAAEAESNVPNKRGHILTPRDIASRLDSTWGVDEEGEIRGMWKRHSNVPNIWIMGGHTQQHRWYSRILALQIKAALEGILPPAYRQKWG